MLPINIYIQEAFNEYFVLDTFSLEKIMFKIWFIVWKSTPTYMQEKLELLRNLIESMLTPNCTYLYPINILLYAQTYLSQCSDNIKLFSKETLSLLEYNFINIWGLPIWWRIFFSNYTDRKTMIRIFIPLENTNLL